MESSRNAGGERRRERVSFNCIFTETIRQLFKRKRIQLGLPYNRLGDFFRVNWSTVRKWEMGPTSSCMLQCRPRVEGFLNGDYDEELLDSQQSCGISTSLNYHISKQDPMHECMERVANTYLLCSHDRSISSGLLADLDMAAKNAISKLVDSQFTDDDDVMPIL